MTSIKQRLQRLAFRTFIAAMAGLFVFVSLGIPPMEALAGLSAERKAFHARAHYGLPRRGIPGVESGVGTEASLTYLLSLTQFFSIPPVSATYYVSSDAGGRAAAGDDDNDGLTWATAVRSLCHIDGIIEAATEPIHVIFDSDGGNDKWITLALELDCENGDYWDGSLGPPHADCSDSIDRPCVTLSASDPLNGVQLDLVNMRAEQVQQDCTGSNYGGNTCDDNNDALFFGRTSAGGRTGWLAVQNFNLNRYPNNVEVSASAPQKDVVGGNVLTLNLDAGWMQGPGASFSNQQGGFDIHINPVVRNRPPSDFDSNCSGSIDSELGCAGADNYAATSQCSAEDTPYGGCSTGAPFLFNTNNMLVSPFAGGTMLISDQTYRFSINRQEAGRTNTIMRAQNGSDLILLGPMQFENEMHTNNDTAYPGNKNDMAYGVTFDATSANLGQSDSTGAWIIAFAGWPETWGQGGGGNGEAPISVDYDGADTGLAWNLHTYGISVLELENAGIFKLPDLHADQTNTGTLTFDCSSGPLVSDGLIYFNIPLADFDSTAAPAFDISARDSYILESLGYIGYIEAEAPGTIADAITFFATRDEFSCGGDATCATNFFEVGDQYKAIKRPIAAAAANRPGACNTEFRFFMPTDDGETSADKLHRNHNAWLPAYVAGERITEWHFGKP